MPYQYEYPRPALTVDCVLFGLDGEGLKVLLIRRKRDPFAGSWAFPGGFVDVGEAPEQAAGRELEEETGLTGVPLEQLHTFGRPDRDPREHVVSVVHYALVEMSACRVRAADDAREAAWFPVRRPPPLAFDHGEILRVACERVREEMCRRPVAFALLPRKFTLSQLHRVYETVLERKIDKRRFRRRMSQAGLLVDTGRIRKEPGRPAVPLYRLDRAKARRTWKPGRYDFTL